MRIFNTTLHDMRFQLKYGFYFIYAVMILFYILLVGIFPVAWKSMATVIVLFIDPAGLGFFFIGGLLLLEKGERVLDALFVSPLRVWEYILAKALSLGLISVLVGVIIAVAGLGAKANIPVLVLSLLTGSVLYTFVGLAAGVRAKTVNQFMIITVPAEILLGAPPILLVFGVKSYLLELLPGSLILRLFQYCTGSMPLSDLPLSSLLAGSITPNGMSLTPVLMLAGLILWSVPAFLLAIGRMKWFLSRI
jgi:fluoroquinolone transport system permease protein